MTRELYDYGRPLETVSSFKYLGSILTDSDENCPSVVGNLRKAQKSRARLSMIMGSEGDSSRVSGMFLKSVVHGVLIFGADTLVMTLYIGRALG